MALTDLTRHLTQLGNTGKTVLDALRPSEVPKVDGTPANAVSSAEGIGATILAEVRAMQNALKDDSELVVLFHNGFETLRVLQFYSPDPQVLVLIGFDAERNTTRVIARADSVQLTCKVMAVSAPAKPVRINFITPPKPKSE